MADRKVLVVIGGTSGIGQKIARRAADRGETVILSGRDSDHVRQVAVEIGGDTTGIAVDLSLPAGLAGQLAGIDRSITWCSRRWPATRTRCGPATPAPRLPW